MIAIDRYQRNPRARAKSDTTLNEVFEEIRSALVETLVKFNFQRFVGGERSGDALIQPESELLFVFRVLWF